MTGALTAGLQCRPDPFIELECEGGRVGEVEGDVDVTAAFPSEALPRRGLSVAGVQHQLWMVCLPPGERRLPRVFTRVQQE